MPNQDLFTIHYAVRGRGEFPRDMLRRDESVFATADDSNLAYNGGQAETLPERTVNLRMPDRGQYDSPNSKRWESFGWKVVDTFRTPVCMSEEQEAEEIAWTRIARARSHLPAGWNLRTTGELTGAARLRAIADNLENIALEVRRVFGELEEAKQELSELRRQRDAVRAFFGVEKYPTA